LTGGEDAAEHCRMPRVPRPLGLLLIMLLLATVFVLTLPGHLY